MVTASAGCGLVVPSESETRVYKKWSGGVRRATTLCRMSAGGAELFWHCVSLGVSLDASNRDWQGRSDLLRHSRRCGCVCRGAGEMRRGRKSGMVTASVWSGLVAPATSEFQDWGVADRTGVFFFPQSSIRRMAFQLLLRKRKKRTRAWIAKVNGIVTQTSSGLSVRTVRRKRGVQTSPEAAIWASRTNRVSPMPRSPPVRTR